MQKVTAKISLESIRKNAESFKRQTGAKLCAVVKANAYGHGAEEVAFALAEIADFFAVALVDEAIALRQAACGKDILVFTPPTTKEEGYTIAANGWIATLPDLSTAKAFAAICRDYGLRGRAHLKGNTGMNRYGMNPSMLGKTCKFLRENPCVAVEGVYSHLYGGTKKTALAQRELFLRMKRIAEGYFPRLTYHLSGTYGALLGKEFAFDAVRIGLGLYGYAPIPTLLPLQKAMRVETKVVCSRKYAFGGAGYGKVRVAKGTQLAVVRAGYADGFLRRKRNGTAGSQDNVNRLCMDVGLRASKRRRGGIVPLMVDADEVAKRTGTIAYEVLCAATRRAEFIYE